MPRKRIVPTDGTPDPDKGIAYLTAAQKVTQAIRRLDDEDAEAMRRISDRLQAKGLGLLVGALAESRKRKAAALEEAATGLPPQA